MNQRRSICTFTTIACLALATATAAVAQDKPPAMSKEQQAMMEAMMKAATPGLNHQLLAGVVGNWTFSMKMWADPAAPPTESTGTARYETMLDGRYVHGEYKGLVMGMAFEGHSVDAFDNVTGKFISIWVDNMGTGIMVLTGQYDPATRTFTYSGEMADPLQPAAKVKIREVIRMLDDGRSVMEMYETRAGKEAKTMEIDSTRVK